MPDGLTHLQVGIIGGAVLIAATALYIPDDLRPVVVGTAIGLIVTPDLDQDGRTATETIMLEIPVIGHLFQWSFYPYATLHRHRGWSHHIIIGTPGRIAYVILLMVFWATVAVGAQWLWSGEPVDWVATVVHPLIAQAHVSLFFAWWVQDALHILADTIA